MLIKPEILEMGLLENIVKEKVKGGLSWGAEGDGYTLRLSNEFKFPKPDVTLDPINKEKTERLFTSSIINRPFILEPHSFVLGLSIERFNLPNNVTAIALTKSSLARVGIFANITTIDCGFKGRLVIELSNLGNNDVKIWPNYGVAKVLFFKHKETENYSGNYQNQTDIRI